MMIRQQLIEDSYESQESWDKYTVEYALNNKDRIMAFIKSLIRNHSSISFNDAEDIYSELLEYLYKSGDYDVVKATNNSTGAVVPIEGYINLCTKNCVKRFAHNRKREQMLKFESSDEDFEILEIISDERVEVEIDDIHSEINGTLKDTLDFIEYKRYIYGFDIFLAMFVRLLMADKQDEREYETVLELLGIEKRKMKKSIKKIMADDDLMIFMRGIAISNREDAIRCLASRVYGAKGLMKALTDV